MTGSHETQWEPRLQPNSLEAGGSTKMTKGFALRTSMWKNSSFIHGRASGRCARVDIWSHRICAAGVPLGASSIIGSKLRRSSGGARGPALRTHLRGSCGAEAPFAATTPCHPRHATSSGTGSEPVERSPISVGGVLRPRPTRHSSFPALPGGLNPSGKLVGTGRTGD